MSYTYLPQEYSFFMEDSTRDNIFENRFKFEFPKEWRTSTYKDPMIGIRRIFIPKSYRHVEFDFIIEKYLKDASGSIPEKPTHELSFHTEAFLSKEHDLRHLRRRFFESFAKAIKQNKMEEIFTLDNLYFCYEYKMYSEKKRLSYCQVFDVINKDPKYEYKFGIYNINDDFKAIFNYNKTEVATGSSPMIFYDVWDRHDNMITSSLSMLNARQYLGFSDEIFKPFKYFKLNSNTNEFWVEFWNSKNREIPNILPFDNKDGLIIEAVLLKSGLEML